MEKPVQRHADDVADIGIKIQKIRTERRLSQEQLADRMMTDRKSVARYEHGEREMGICTFIQLVEALETAPADLLPERLSGEQEVRKKTEALITLAESLSENDLDLLISMAERMSL